jgi:hypothetical protein
MMTFLSKKNATESKIMTGNFAQTTVTVSAPQLIWVKLNRYCELSGESKEAVYTKRKNGIWIDGMQYKRGPDGNVWINLMEVELWIQTDGNLQSRLKSLRASKLATRRPVKV